MKRNKIKFIFIFILVSCLYSHFVSAENKKECKILFTEMSLNLGTVIQELAQLKYQINDLNFTLPSISSLNSQLLAGKLNIDFNNKLKELFIIGNENNISEKQISLFLKTEIEKIQNENEFGIEKRKLRNQLRNESIKNDLEKLENFFPTETYSVYQKNVIMKMAVTPDSKYFISASKDYSAKVIELATGQEVYKIGHIGEVSDVRVSHDGKYIVTSSWDKTVRVTEVGTWKEVFEVKHIRAVSIGLISPDGKYIISGSSSSHQLKITEFGTGKTLFLTTVVGILDISISPDNKYLIVSSSEGKRGLRLFEMGSWNEIVLDRNYEGLVFKSIFSPDGKYLAFGSSDYKARVLEVGSWKELTSIVHDNIVTSLAFSLDSQYLTTVSYDSKVIITEANQWNPIKTIPMDGFLDGVIPTVDGKYFVIMTNMGALKIFKIGSWEEVFSLEKTGTQKSAMAVSPDGLFLMISSDRYSVKVIRLYRNFFSLDSKY